MIDEFKKEKREIGKLYKEKRHFEVVVISIQLLTKIADYISETHTKFAEEWAEEEPEYKEIMQVGEIYWKNLRSIKSDDAPKAKIQGVFYEIVFNEGFEHYTKREVTSLMHKVERVVSFRNVLAHEYHNRQTSIKRNLSIRSKECLELVSAIENHPWF